MELEIINAKLNPLRDDEVRAIVEIEMHPAVRRWLVEYAFEDFDKELEDYKRFFREIRSNDKVEVLVAKLEDRIVGFLALRVVEGCDEQVSSIGVSVHPDYWGGDSDQARKRVNKASEGPQCEEAGNRDRGGGRSHETRGGEARLRARVH